MTSTWKIYWWAHTDMGKKRGSDIVTIDGDKFSEADAEALLEGHAEGDSGLDVPRMPNFENYYPNATHCLNYGFVKVERVEERSKQNSRKG